METEFKLKDFADVYALCLRRADSFSIIGDHFCQIFRGRDIVSVCLTLVASYQECESIIFVTQRLIIVYLLYRLKELGKVDVELQDAKDAEITLHPFLLIFVKIYADFILFANGEKASIYSDTGILRLIGNFPKITPQEAHFVGQLLVESPVTLKQLFRLSPAQVADNPVPNVESKVDIKQMLKFVEKQLDQFRVFGREGIQDNLCDAKGTVSLPSIDPSLLNHYARIVYSLLPPPFVRIEPSVMPPCEDEFRFIYPSLIEPEQVQDDWLKDEEWNQEKMRPLEKTQHGSPGLRLSLRNSAPPSPSGARKQQFTPEIPFSVVSAGGYGAPNLESLAQTAKSPPTRPLSVSANNPLMSRSLALEYLKKIVAGSHVMLSKSDMMRLSLTVSEDPEILKEVNVGDDFSKLVDCQPEIAAEILFYEMTTNAEQLTFHYEVLLNVELSVHSLVAVNKFISSCENKQVKIPEDFLNRFITHCMTTCEQNDANQLMTNRLVRMVCVFFTSLLRLRHFDIRVWELTVYSYYLNAFQPRLTEMQNFSTAFLLIKEASALYQCILETENWAAKGIQMERK